LGPKHLHLVALAQVSCHKTIFKNMHLCSRSHPCVQRVQLRIDDVSAQR
jgi:hypothetical protein